jgi:EmrB/QacA subfamily drug resistance transporter
VSTAAASDQSIDAALRRQIWILVLGALAPALDTTIVNVALDTLGRTLHASVTTSQWTITGYLLAMGMAMPVTGWVSERFGDKRTWLFSLTMFLAGSALSGAAWNMASLIVFRLVQGVGAGLMLPVVTTMLVQVAGAKRLGAMMTIAMLPVVVVPIFGPVVGGLILNSASWRWIFYVNVPICLAAMWLAWRKMPPSTPASHPHRLDVLGLVLLSPGLALIIYGLSQTTGTSGFATTSAWAPLLAGLALTAAFTLHALRQRDRQRDRPLINLSVLRVRSLAASVGVLFLAGLSVYGPLLLLALYYQDVQGKSAIVTGLLLAPQGIGSLLPRGIAGKLSDRIGPRPVVITGLALTALGTLPFAWAGPATNQWLLAGSLFVRGAGLAPVTIAAMVGAFRDVAPREVPDASSTTRIVQQIGGSFGAAVLAVILATALRSHAAVTAAARGLAFNTAFWWAIGLTLLALLPALLLPAALGPRARSKRHKRPQERAG